MQTIYIKGYNTIISENKGHNAEFLVKLFLFYIICMFNKNIISLQNVCKIKITTNLLLGVRVTKQCDHIFYYTYKYV